MLLGRLTFWPRKESETTNPSSRCHGMVRTVVSVQGLRADVTAGFGRTCLTSAVSKGETGLPGSRSCVQKPRSINTMLSQEPLLVLGG